MSEPRIGELDKRVIIEAPSDAQDDDQGEIVKEPWAYVTTKWAQVRPARGREGVIDGGTLAELDTEIVMKWDPLTDTLTAKNRFRYKSTVYNVVSIVPSLLGQSYVIFQCKSGVNDG